MATLRIAALKAGKITPRDKAIRDWVESYRARIKSVYPKAVFETEFILGCSVPEFVAYIESLMQPGMSWDNKAGKWEIKVTIGWNPLLREEPGEFYRYYHYTNMRPVWKKVKGFIADPSSVSPLDRDGDQV